MSTLLLRQLITSVGLSLQVSFLQGFKGHKHSFLISASVQHATIPSYMKPEPIFVNW